MTTPTTPELFDDAFARLAADDAAPAAAPVTTPAETAAPAAAAAAETPASAAAGNAAPSTETPAPATETPAEETTPKGETPKGETPKGEAAKAEAPKGETTDDQLMERFARVVAAATQQPPAEKPKPEEKAEEPAMYTPEEQQLLEAYTKEWGEVQQAESLLRRKEYVHLTQHIFSEVEKVLGPMQQILSQLAASQFYKELTSAVPDYSDDLPEQVKAWAEKQPAYLRDAYMHVIEKGTVDEVKDLVTRFRTETGTPATSTPKPAAPAARTTAEVELPTPTKQAASELAPVESKRSAAGPVLDATDFSSAFEHFAAKT